MAQRRGGVALSSQQRYLNATPESKNDYHQNRIIFDRFQSIWRAILRNDVKSTIEEWRRGGDLNPRGITPTRCPDDNESYSSLAPYRAELPLRLLQGSTLIRWSYITVYRKRSQVRFSCPNHRLRYPDRHRLCHHPRCRGPRRSRHPRCRCRGPRR